jgi:predicted DNA-binding transcriptional regulator AlpA
MVATTALLSSASAPPNTADPIDPLLKDDEAAVILGCSTPTFWRRVAAGIVPPPVKLGGMSRWPRSEILAVIEKAKAARYSTSEAA